MECLKGAAHLERPARIAMHAFRHGLRHSASRRGGEQKRDYRRKLLHALALPGQYAAIFA